MSKKKNGGRVHLNDAPGKLLSRADNAFRRDRMTKAYHLYGEAIAHLEAMWDATQNAQVGFRLAKAYIFGYYPAWRKYLGRNTPKAQREDWFTKAYERGRAGVELEIELAHKPVAMSDEDVFSAICNLHNLATDLLHYKQDNSAADYFVREAYKLLEVQRPGDTMPPQLHFGFVEMKARIAYNRREFATALALVDEVIAFEQAKVDKARRRHKKLPPANWLKAPTELRDSINKAVMQAATESVRNAKL